MGTIVGTTIKYPVSDQKSELFKCLDQGGGGGGSNKAWDRETMFSQLAKRSARQRFSERAGKISAVISPVVPLQNSNVK